MESNDKKVMGIVSVRNLDRNKGRVLFTNCCPNIRTYEQNIQNQITSLNKPNQAPYYNDSNTDGIEYQCGGALINKYAINYT